jgi:hypothetical protein
VPREKGIRYFGFACGIPSGRDGSPGGDGDGSQRSGMKDNGSGYILGLWWIRGACILTATCGNLAGNSRNASPEKNPYIWWNGPFPQLKHLRWS